MSARRWGQKKTPANKCHESVIAPSVTPDPPSQISVDPEGTLENTTCESQVSAIQERVRPRSVCIVGSGLAAMTVARRLQRHGFEVRVVGYCGGRNLGGRCFSEVWDLQAHRMQGPNKVTKRTPNECTTVKFDTGCQWFTAENDAFKEELQDWCAKGSAAEWSQPRIGSWAQAGGFVETAPDSLPRIFAGVGGMASITHTLMQEIGESRVTFAVARRFYLNSATCKYSVEVEIDMANNHLSFIGGNLPQFSQNQKLEEEFDYVVMAQGLAAKQPRMVEFENSKGQAIVDHLCANLRYQTLMVLTMVFRKPLPLAFDICKLEPSTQMGLVVLASSKPGMEECQYETWTVFSSAAFAQQYALPKTKSEGLKALLDIFMQTFNLERFRKDLISSHGTPFGLLWPHGQPTRKLPGCKRAIFCAESKVGVCADYCGGPPCVESAVVSAIALADAMAAHRDGKPLADDIVTNLDTSWEDIAIPLPWEVAHFPGMPAPFQMEEVPKLLPAVGCCPTHDWLGIHPGLCFGRSAAAKPWERIDAREEWQGICSGKGGKKGSSTLNCSKRNFKHVGKRA